MGMGLSRFRKNKPSEWVAWLSDDEPVVSSHEQAATPRQYQVHRPTSYVTSSRPSRSTGSPVTTSAQPMTGPRPIAPAPPAPPGIAQPIVPPGPTRALSQPSLPQPQTAAVPARPAGGRSLGGITRPGGRSVQPLAFMGPTAMAVPAQQSSPMVTSPGERSQSAPTTAVSIQISMPKIQLPKLPALPYRRIGYWAGGSALALGLLTGGWMTYRHFAKSDAVAVKGATTTSTSPTFNTFAPESKPQLGEGADAENTAYDGNRGLYSYKDTLMGFPIVVSQQPLPDNLKKDPGKLRDVAQGMGSTVASVDTAYGIVYVSTDKDGKAQRGIFAHGDVLLLIQSYKTFDNDTWKFYIETLRQ